MNRRNRRAGIAYASRGANWRLSVAIGTHLPCPTRCARGAGRPKPA